MTPQTKSPIPAEKAALYEKAVATLPGVERKSADNPYTFLNGNMCSLVSAQTETRALRLPKEEREAFLKKYQSKLFESVWCGNGRNTLPCPMRC
ncbi:MAG: hypothetical protein QOJ41_643 [Acidobacteriaceae bacterium]|nr:hypothetical protein [Acidobacteriaceae bacterium]